MNTFGDKQMFVIFATCSNHKVAFEQTLGWVISLGCEIEHFARAVKKAIHHALAQYAKVGIAYLYTSYQNGMFVFCNTFAYLT